MLPDDLIPHVESFFDALGMTISLGVSCILMMLCTAFVLSFARRSPVKSISFVAGAVVEFLRSTSAIVLLFWMFYSVPLLPFNFMPSVQFSVVFSLGLAAGAYGAEVIRGAANAVQIGQTESADVLGIKFLRREVRIIFPQALPMALPSLESMAIEVFKWSAAASLVTAHDVVAWSLGLQDRIGHGSLIFAGLLILFYVLSRVIAASFRLVGMIVFPSQRYPKIARSSRRRDRVDLGFPMRLPVRDAA